jgi:hypothetical protein
LKDEEFNEVTDAGIVTTVALGSQLNGVAAIEDDRASHNWQSVCGNYGLSVRAFVSI